MRKYKSQKGVALIFAIMIIAIMSIVGALALYIANRESKSVIAEQQKTRAYYAARTGADIADKFISSTPKKDVIDLFTRYEGAKMLYDQDKRDDNQWYPVYYEKKSTVAGVSQTEKIATGEYFQLMFKKNSQKGIQLVSRGAVLKPGVKLPIDATQDVIKNNILLDKTSSILGTYSSSEAEGDDGRLIPSVINTAAYVNSHIAMRGGSSITYTKDLTNVGPAVMTGITDEADIDVNKNILGAATYAKIYGQFQVPEVSSSLLKTFEERKVLEDTKNLVASENLPKPYLPIDIPQKETEFQKVTQGSKSLAQLWTDNPIAITNREKGYDKIISDPLTTYSKIVVRLGLGDRSSLKILADYNPSLVADEFIVESNKLYIKGSGVANIYSRKFKNLGVGAIIVEGGATANFYVDDLSLDADIIIKDNSKVNFYVRKSLVVDDGQFNYNSSDINNADQLNIYYYGDSNATFNRANWHFKGNVYMAGGNLVMGNAVGTLGTSISDVRPFFVGNIFSSGGDINISVGLASTEKYKANAFIYAPLSTVSIAPYGEKVLTAATSPKVSLAGSIICDKLDMGINTSLIYNAIPKETLPKNEDVVNEMYKIEQINFGKLRWDRID